MKLNQLSCPDCNTRMVVIWETTGVYGAHACFTCNTFHTLKNVEDFEV